MSRCLRSLAVIVPLTLVAAGCSDGDGSGFAAAVDGGNLQTIAGSLALLPDSGEPVETIVWGDLARADEVAGVTRPDGAGDQDAVMDYLGAVTGLPADGGGPQAFLLPPDAAHTENPELQQFADELGWSLLDVDRFVERQTPPGVVTVMEGSFDEGALTEAIGEPEDGTWVVGSGNGGELNPSEVSPARPLGESLWLGLDSDRLSVTRFEEHAAAVDRAAAGGDDTPTFAGDEGLSGVAAALDSASPYAAMLVRPGPSGPSGRAAQETPDAACDQALPEATTAVGTAVTDDGGPVILVALAHDSAAATQANADALERIATEGTSLLTQEPWSDLVTFDGVSVTGNDRVVLGRLRPREDGQAGIWFRLLMQGDSLVTSC